MWAEPAAAEPGIVDAVLSPDVAYARVAPAVPSLAPRELEVLQLLLQGCAVDEIGRRMALSHKTVANYQTAIRSIQNTGIEVTGIKDVTPVPHNGCRPPKRRRV